MRPEVSDFQILDLMPSAHLYALTRGICVVDVAVLTATTARGTSVAVASDRVHASPVFEAGLRPDSA
jgi:hypothetical protein